MCVTSPVQIAGADLRDELQERLSQHFGTRTRISRLRRRRSNYSSSYTIESVEVDLANGTRLKLILKDLSPGSPLVSSKNVRPSFLYDPLREIGIYRSILDPARFGTAICYGATEQPQDQRYWLFLERIEGPLLWQVGRFDRWLDVARWLGHFHGAFAANAQQLSDVNLLCHDAAHYRRWLERADRFLSRSDLAHGSALRSSFKKLAIRYDRVVDRLVSMPPTLIHGEFYPSNILMRAGRGASSVCPIDWETAAVGPGLIDLAALVSGSWSEQHKGLMLQTYLERATNSKSWLASRAEAEELVGYCQLQLAVQWLGWASDWCPPKSHQQNWLEEAILLAKRLCLI